MKKRFAEAFAYLLVAMAFGVLFVLYLRLMAALLW